MAGRLVPMDRGALELFPRTVAEYVPRQAEKDKAEKLSNAEWPGSRKPTWPPPPYSTSQAKPPTVPCTSPAAYAEEGCASRGQIGRLHQKAAVRCGFGLFKAAEMVHTRPWPHQDASRRHQHGIRAVREAVCRSFQARTGVFARNQRRLRGCIAGRSLRCRAASANKAKPDDDALRREVAARVRLHGGRGSGAVSARAYCRGMGAGIPGRRSASSAESLQAWRGSAACTGLRLATSSDRGARTGMQDAAPWPSTMQCERPAYDYAYANE